MRPKIYYSLKESKFKLDVGNYVLYFSSEFYLNKFKTMQPIYTKTEREKLISRFNILVRSNNYFDIILYKLIEKRGFLIKDRVTDTTFTSSNQFYFDFVFKKEGE